MLALNSSAFLQIEEALRIFQDMVQRGCERNVITYSSLIAACEKAGRWQLALELLEEMHRDGCKPNVVTFNSLIGACGQGNPLQTLWPMSCCDSILRGHGFCQSAAPLQGCSLYLVIQPPMHAGASWQAAAGFQKSTTYLMPERA